MSKLERVREPTSAAAVVPCFQRPPTVRVTMSMAYVAQRRQKNAAAVFLLKSPGPFRFYGAVPAVKWHRTAQHSQAENAAKSWQNS